VFKQIKDIEENFAVQNSGLQFGQRWRGFESKALRFIFTRAEKTVKKFR